MTTKTSPKSRGKHASFDELSDDAYVRLSQLVPDVVPISPATVWRGSNAGTFPKSVKLGPRVTAWRVGDIRKWLNERAAEGVSA